jgi:hypothetical protein
MKGINAAISLKQLIQAKESELLEEEELLKYHLYIVNENLKPATIIKNAFNELISLANIKAGITNTLIDAATTFVAKKVVTGKSSAFFMRIVALLFEKAISLEVKKNTDDI